MRKALFLLVLVSFFACNNVAKFKDAITNLTTDWDSATSLVTDFAGKLNGAQAEMNTMKDAMNLTEEVKAMLTEEQKASVQQYISQFGVHNQTLGQLSGDVFGFVNTWQEKAQEVEALKTGLTEGKLPENVQEQIDGLTGMIAEAKGKVSGWEDTLTNTSSEAKSVYQQFKSIIEKASQPAG
jgi:flagellar biosynthesis chaperone FliJ